MSKPIKISILMSFVALVAFSCGKRNKLHSTDNPEQTLSVLLNRLEFLSTLEWDFLSAKTQVRVTSKERSDSFKASIRMKRDSAILVNISFAGFPIFQTAISNDSLKLLNRKDKCYKFHDRTALEQFVDFPVDYAQLQDLLIGKPLIFNRAMEHIQIQDNDFYVVRTKRPRIAGTNLPFESNPDISIMYYLDVQSLELSKVILDSPSDKAKVEITYTGKHEKIEGLMLPQRVVIVITTPDDVITIEIAYNRPDIEQEKKINFNVPDNYGKCGS